ncbi:MAG: SBBP repeat-containing protein [Holophagales bacterium]|nr:SBBP repeat-containing protein [Holophagales bacterium]MBK9967643.1 SBBP repeat-containing protein [Holophagales bacterium]
MTPRLPRASTMFLAVALSVATGAQAAGHVFSKRFGGASDQSITSVAVDGAGNVVVTGSFVGTIDFGGGALTSAGSQDIFLAKVNSNGTHLWSKRFGDSTAQAASGVAVDGSGNIYLTGFMNGTVDFGGGALASAGGQDVFVVRFDAGGNHAWSKRFGDASNQLGTGIAVDGTGSVVQIGTFSGSMDFGGGTLTSAGSTDVFLARYDSGGNHAWSKRFGDASAQTGTAIAVDPNGNVVGTGSFNGTVNFGGTPLTSAGSTDIFLAKYDSGGTHAWSKRLGDASAQTGTAVAFDGSGNVVVAGSFNGSTNFGGGALTSVGGADAFLARYDPDGTHTWSRAFGSTGTDSGNGVAVDGTRDVVLTGGFQGTVNFGGGPLTSAGGTDFFLARYTPSGVHTSSARAGDATEQEGLAASSDASGNSLLAGRFQGSADFGGGTLTSAGGYDAFLVKLGTGQQFHTVAPCRAVDTRNAVGPWGGPALAPGPSNRVFSIAGVCGVPTTAVAVSVNITVTQTGAAGTLRLYPGDTGAAWIPTATSISFAASKTRANNASVLLSRDGTGSLGVRNDAPDTVHFILDVTGYFE